MSKIVLEGNSLKVVNKGGFIHQSHEKVMQLCPALTITGQVKETLAKVGIKDKWKTVPGATYYVFVCPGCGKRNKRPLKSAKYQNDVTVAFACNGCGNTIEMSREVREKSESRIILP